MFIEDTPEEQVERQRYTTRARELQEQLGALQRRKVTAYAPSSLALIEQQLQAMQEELQRLHQSEEARVAGL